MIGERYATGARPVATRQRRVGMKERLAGRPAVAGRERLYDALGRSLAVQLMLVMSLVVFAALIYLAQAAQGSVAQYEISNLQAQAGQLRQQNAQLHAEATHLQSLNRIDTAATQLHMVKPDITSTLWVQPVIPVIQPVPSVNADVYLAERQSQPSAWVDRFITFIKSSL